MADITVDTLISDLKGRVLNVDGVSDIPQAVHRRITSDRRMKQAISEAVNDFVLSQKASGLAGFIADGLVDLEDSGAADYTGLRVYRWPDAAFTERADGGILHLVLDGQLFNILQINRELPANPMDVMSLQQQANNTLLYGPGHRNAVADMFSNKIYVPAKVTAKAKVVKAPVPLAESNAGTLPIAGFYQDWIADRAYGYLLGNVGRLVAVEDETADEVPVEEA